MRILFLVRGLNVGGAERQLAAVARGLRQNGHQVAVAVFYGGGLFEEELRADGITIHDLAKRGRFDLLPVMTRLVCLVRRERPDVLHAYMGLANLFSAVLKPLFPPVTIVWGIRDAIHDLSAYGWLSAVGQRLERMTFQFADAVVANSHAAQREAVCSGMDAGKIIVIPNGTDCDAFHPDPIQRRVVRKEWGIEDDQALVGIVARLDPVKGHPTFLRAAALLAAMRQDVRFVCVGDGTSEYRKELVRLASDLGLSSRLTWAGERRVTNAVYSAFDVAVLSSNVGESFPNVVAEAMACGTPCVVTESGDAPYVVGDTGAVVPPQDPDALARGILRVLERLRDSGPTLSAEVRARVERDFSVQILVHRTEEALERVRKAG